MSFLSREYPATELLSTVNSTIVPFLLSLPCRARLNWQLTTELINLIVFRITPHLGIHPSNGCCLQLRCIAMGLYATVSTAYILEYSCCECSHCHWTDVKYFPSLTFHTHAYYKLYEEKRFFQHVTFVTGKINVATIFCLYVTNILNKRNIYILWFICLNEIL
jgi:hypothetical protein